MEIIDFQEIQKKVVAARKKLSREREAFFWLLYYCGVRKSEAYERVAEDVELSLAFFSIDFHKRKKGGLTVPPLRLPRSFPGVDLLCELSLRAQKHRASRKLLERSEKGIRHAAYFKGKWLFPHMNRSWALKTIKLILGEKYYPHFLRLNRISELCTDPSSNISRISSFTGIKTLQVIEYYLGSSRKEQEAAVDFMAKQIRPENRKSPGERT